MSSTSATFHGITSISVRYHECPGVQVITFTLRDGDGGWHDVTAHVEGPIEIQGAEFVNFMAAKEKEPAPA